MADGEAMEPDERTFRRHVAGGRFQQGVDRGEWRVVDAVWPNPIIAASAEIRAGAPTEVALRFTLGGYPTLGPTSEPWDAEAGTPLPHELWPTGPTGSRVATAFNPAWQPRPGIHAIYIPMDRTAIEGHDQWHQLHPALIWDPTRMTIVDYLKVIHELLHSSQYSGVRRAA